MKTSGPTAQDSAREQPAGNDEAPAAGQPASSLLNRLGRMVCLVAGHDWQHCACRRCGHPRDTNHDWQPIKDEPCKLKCSVCGLPHFNHQFSDRGICRVCGAAKAGPGGSDSWDTCTTFWTTHRRR